MKRRLGLVMRLGARGKWLQLSRCEEVLTLLEVVSPHCGTDTVTDTKRNSDDWKALKESGDKSKGYRRV